MAEINEPQERWKNDKSSNGNNNIANNNKLFDSNIKGGERQIVLHNDSEVLGLKKGRYGLIKGEFVERLN